MPTIIINLKDIIIDPDSTVDLAALPAGEAIDRIKQSYGFLASSVDVSVANGAATISLNEPPTQKGDDAVKTYNKAVQDAQQGDYAKAIKRFEKVLATLPLHVEARRNLAMACLESGDAGKALEHLKECIQLDPQNVWSYLLLGNIYAQQHKNYDVAEFYFQKGLSISPTDNILLNNYAVVKIGRQQFKEAQSLFEQALASDPSYPNTYVGLARLHQSQGNTQRALELLQTLFAQPKSQDIRSAPMYQQAWNLFVEINREVAEKNCDELIAAISDHKKEIEERTGFPVSIVEDDSLDFLSGQVQMAWKHNRTDHLIRYRKKQPAVAPHLIAHEIEHILLEDAARKRGRNLFFTTTERSREHALRAIGDHSQKLQKQGYDKEKASQLLLQLASGLCGQLFNCPIDMMVEYSVYKKYDNLRPSQIFSLNHIYQEAYSVFTNTEIRKVAPPFIHRASLTLNCASALFLDYLFSNASDYAAPYKSSPVFPVGLQLFNIWKNKLNSFTPGDEYGLVDEFARLLKLQNWYEWKPDTVAPPADAGTAIATNPQLLKEKESAAYTYCLDALKRFDSKSRDEIFKIASEIGLLGEHGIDYKNPTAIYTLKSIPQEQFCGLHLMSLMFVGFKITRPDIATGLDFNDAYQLALEAYKASVH